MEKKLLQEVNRFRQMVGLNLINEGREKLIGAISDLKGKASELFGASTRTSPEGIFYMKVNSATDEATMKRILSETVNKAFTRRLIQKTMIDSGAKVAKTMEYGIVKKFERGETISEVKSKLQTFINTNIESPFKDEIIKYYDDCIDEVFTGKKGEDVFGREVKDPRTPKPDPANSAKELEIAKNEMNQWLNTFDIPSKYKKIIRDRIDNMTEAPASSSASVESMVNESLRMMNLNPNVRKSVMKEVGDFIGYLFNPKSEQQVSSFLKITRKVLWSGFIIYLLYRVAVLGIDAYNAGEDKLKNTLDLGGYKGSEREEVAKKVEEVAKKVEEAATPPQESAFDK